ncbi:MAG: Maf family protein [Candidatus Woesebacteria bacterium]|nr:Maf family protein [Candidatus Woesebacteria bacterium]
MKTKIILASGSKQRKMMMDALGISFVVIPADINEKEIRDENLELRAEKIARAKAEEVAKKHHGIIISADTFSTCNGKILEKPKSLDEARDMLKLQANKTCILYTGFCYLDKTNRIDYSATAITKYVLRRLSDSEIDNFVKNNPVTDWSAAFSPAYPYQMGFIKKIEGSLTGLTHGLPVELLIPCLEKSGVKV